MDDPFIYTDFRIQAPCNFLSKNNDSTPTQSYLITDVKCPPNWSNKSVLRSLSALLWCNRRHREGVWRRMFFAKKCKFSTHAIAYMYLEAYFCRESAIFVCIVITMTIYMGVNYIFVFCYSMEIFTWAWLITIGRKCAKKCGTNIIFHSDLTITRQNIPLNINLFLIIRTLIVSCLSFNNKKSG